MSDIRMYGEIADWWPILSDPADYDEEASIFLETLMRCSTGALTRVLELGCGGGNNASHLKAHFEMSLVDISSDMLEVSRALNPECEHVLGDMRTIRLDREFDAVFVHDAIMYMLTEDDLRAVMETAYVHTRPGGVALFVPDFIAETLQGYTKRGGHDGGGRSLRYLEWVYDPDPDDTTFLAYFTYMLREGDGPVRFVNDEHVMGVFPRRTWVDLLTEVGFEARVIANHLSSFDPPVLADLFVGVKGT